MLISSPFLAPLSVDSDEDAQNDPHAANGPSAPVVQDWCYAFTGAYPVTSHLEWHNGVHVVGTSPRAIADGTVVYVVPPDAQPSTNKDHAQNYPAFGSGPEWTDKGMVILKHTTEIGANGTTPVEITFYSVYMHLKALGKGRNAQGVLKTTPLADKDTVYRKDIIGETGQIYGQPDHMHFEICMDDNNIGRLLGHAPSAHPKANVAPQANGRTDVVFGSSYVYLPANTPILGAEPSQHVGATNTEPLGTALWMQMDYNAGSATLTSYYAKDDANNSLIKLGGLVGGSEAAAQVRDVAANGFSEYKLYEQATKRHNSLTDAQKAKSSPSAWYELLRFGRVLSTDPLPTGAQHWRKIKTPTGEKWADLYAAGTYKFSDADFPAFLGWQFIDDDYAGDSGADQRCDSEKLRKLLLDAIEDPDAKTKAQAKTSEGRQRLAKTAVNPSEGMKKKLRKLICKFPTEFEQGNIEKRYGHIKDEEYFVKDTDAWGKLEKHIKSLTCTDLSDAKGYLDAQWRFHPEAFVNVMRGCCWLSKDELVRATRATVKSNKGAENEFLSNKILLEWLETSTTSRPANLQNALMQTVRKYGINTPQRLAYLFGQLAAETGRYKVMIEMGQDGYFSKYEPGTDQGTKLGNTQKGDGVLFKGRGIIQLTGRGNYSSYGDYKGTQYLDSSTVLLLGQVALLTTDAGGFYWAAKQKYIQEKDAKGKIKLVKSGEQGINYWCDQGTSMENAKEVTKRINPAALHFEEVRWPCFEHALYTLNDAINPPDNFKPITK